MSTAIVTGASQGFGQALAFGLAGAGWSVVAAGRARDRLARTRDFDPARITTVVGDLRDEKHLDALVSAARRTGGLDLLVHNASELGPSPLPRLEDVSPTDLLDLFAVNVAAPLALTQRALPLLRKSAAPAIVALSSDAAVEAYPGWGAYGASKAALDHLMRVLAAEAAEAGRASGLVVYSFDPGDMRTAMHQRAFPAEDISDRPDPATVVPALVALLRQRPSSGRYTAADLLIRPGASEPTR